ncbi:MAG: NAD(P)H-hydrate dehydratase [Deltaproteobacteria bacterium]|nr:NAD(P)H-hydrate dehydratase [Deltaproteobacteria bacterium]
MYLVTTEEMQEIDRQTIHSFGIPGRVLMENAGRGATRFLFEEFQALAIKKVGVAAGHGNNGGDGFVIARYLAQKGIKVTVYLFASRSMVKGDAAANLNLLDPLNVDILEIPDPKAFEHYKASMTRQDIWVDAILGTGLKSDVKAYFKQIIDVINSLNKPVFAVDIPSGLNSNTGKPCGTCIRAQATATFAFAKTGHLLFPGADYTGKLKIVDIGIPPYIAGRIGPKYQLLTPEGVSTCFQQRAFDTHKGITGHVLILAGSTGKTGAAAMTAMAAMRTGAGLVTLGIPKSLNPIIESQVIEAMTCPLAETPEGMLDDSSFDTIMSLLSDKKSLALGPGLGTSRQTKKIVHGLILESTVPLVIDADGLNCLAGNLQVLKERKAEIILTPHPGEMARLMDSTPQFIQENRITCARDFAENFDLIVVLKGARTLIAHPDGKIFINPTGNPGMASGGMGDVLTGIIAALIAQGHSSESAAHAAVYLHGAAADTLAESTGPFGFLASDVIKKIPMQIKKIMHCQKPKLNL